MKENNHVVPDITALSHNGMMMFPAFSVHGWCLQPFSGITTVQFSSRLSEFGSSSDQFVTFKSSPLAQRDFCSENFMKATFHMQTLSYKLY